MPSRSYSSPRGLYQTGRIMAALKVSPLTRAELCAKLHLSIGTVCYYLGHLMEKPRRVRICGYSPAVRRGRRPPIYALGSAPDKPEPPRETREDRYKKLKADDDKYNRHLTRKRVKEQLERAVQSPHGWAHALMGK